MNCDFLASLWQQEGDREAGKLNMTILKSRFGINKPNISFDVDYSNLRIMDSADDYEQSDDIESQIENILNN